MTKKAIIFLLLAIVFVCLTISSAAQTKTRKPAKKTIKPPTVAAGVETPQKKNTRAEITDAPATTETVQENKVPQKKNRPEKTNGDNPTAKSEPKYNYYYEFAQKDFLVRRVVIEHDENGKGKISFEKKDFDEPVSDPVQLSPSSLEKIKGLFQTLNFLDSTETYQSAERNYAHLGTVKIRRIDNGRDRLVEYNWTENKDARALADEYRKIANQYVWQFDMAVARENQPLEAPGLMDLLDSYLKRGEISDPPQMIPFLKELSNDERIPLMARNKATKLVKQIEKK
jgi:hypothetical protein